MIHDVCNNIWMNQLGAKLNKTTISNWYHCITSMKENGNA